VRAAVLLILATLLVPAAPVTAADRAVSRSPAAQGHAGATQAPPPTDPAEPPAATANPFLPDNENPTECLSSLPRPECGSEERGGAIQLLTFAILMLGMTFIGWRIALGVRRRDRAMSPDDV